MEKVNRAWGTWTTKNYQFKELKSPPNIDGISWKIDDNRWPYSDRYLGGHYQQCYNALKSFRPYLSCLGIFPITELPTVEPSSKDAIGGIQWDVCKLIWTVITSGIIIATIYLGLFENALLIPSPTERNAMLGFVMAISASAFINVISMTIQARQWPLFFRRWQTVNYILGIDSESELRSYVRNIFKTFVPFMALCFAMTMTTMYLKPILQHYPGDLYPVYAVLFNTHVLPCIVVPEMIFLFVCIITSTRLQHICKRLRHVMMASLMSSTSSHDQFDHLQKLRIAYQLTMISIQHVNHIMGPVLIVSCLTNIYCPIVSVYLYVRQITDYGLAVIRVFLTFLAVCRIIPICFFAHSARQNARTVATILYKVSTVRMTENSTQEAEFFMECSTSQSAFSASGYFDVDRGFLTAIIGILLTYTVTIVQLEGGTGITNSLLNSTMGNVTINSMPTEIYSTVKFNLDLITTATYDIQNFTISSMNPFN